MGSVPDEPRPPTPAVALPTREDPLAAASSEWLGGPAGERVAPGRSWWTPLRVSLAAACVVLALGVLADAPCRAIGWADRSDATLWTAQCYSDVPLLYRERGLSGGGLVYLDSALEYPVLTGVLAQVSAWAARAAQWVVDPDPGRGDPEVLALAEGVRLYEVTALLMGVAALVVVAATARTVRRRPWDGLLVAAAPVLLLTSTINWDLLPAALTAVAVLAWTRERPALTGVLLGLGAAAKLYPVLLLLPLLLVCLRAGPRRVALTRWTVTAASAAAAWAAVNLPVALLAPESWQLFWTFNADRGAEFGSPWFALEIVGRGVPADSLDLVAAGTVAAGLLLVVALAMLAQRPPRLAQLAFLTVAVFVLANKVWSPQYALWLLPLAVLARPRWRDLLIWQAAEVAHFVVVWLFIAGRVGATERLVTDAGYASVIALRAAGLLWLVAVVVRDVLRPEHDPVRPYEDVVPEPHPVREGAEVPAAVGGAGAQA
jgi:uncharacterized membrane protein